MICPTRHRFGSIVLAWAAFFCWSGVFLAGQAPAEVPPTGGNEPARTPVAPQDRLKLDRPTFNYAGSHALFVVVKRYKAGWPALETESDELRTLAAILTTQGFQVEWLEDPTVQDLSSGILRFIKSHGYDRGNRLLIYFRGQAYTAAEGDQGFLLGVDSPRPGPGGADRDLRRKSLPFNYVLSWAEQITSRHAIFLFDSCFSAKLFESKRLPDSPPNLTSHTALPIRQFLTAGKAGEKLSSKSYFASTVAEALSGKGDLSGDGYLTGSELAMFVSASARVYPDGVQQTPQYAPIQNAEFNQGDLVFTLPVAPPSAAPPAPVAGPGGLIVNTQPAGAEVRLGGVALEKSPAIFRDLEARRYPVSVTLDGYEPYATETEIKPDQFTELPLIKLERSTGTLVLRSDPGDLAWELVDRPLGAEDLPPTGRTPAALAKAPVGVYTVVFHRPGWPDLKVEATVPRMDKGVAEAVYQPGRLEIDSQPAGATVFGPEGQELGKTPLAIPGVPPGEYVYVLKLTGYRSASLRTVVDAGRIVALKATLDVWKGPLTGQNWTVPKYGIWLNWVGPGSFTMGNNEGDSDEQPAHEVRLSQGYWLGKYEVTQAEYQAVMNRNPSQFKNAGATAPVEKVTWDEAMEFCQKITMVEGEAGRLPDGYVFSLPTEAQWEYACRAGSQAEFGGSGKLEEMGWFGRNSRKTTHPVGQKQPNDWNFYDMHGNVWEWCRDWFDSYPAGSVVDPVGASTGDTRVSRGGGWQDFPEMCRSTSRVRNAPDSRDETLGFRVALTPDR